MTARMQEGDGLSCTNSSSRLYHRLVCLYKGKVLPPPGHIAKGNRLSWKRASPVARAEGGRRPDRRGEIIAAAIRVIARDGIRACTVSALGLETGFARGHFTYHFRSKNEIIGLAFATVASDWATAQVVATTGSGALERLKRRVRAAVEWVQRRPEYFRCLMNFRVEMMRDPTAFPPAARIRHQIWDFIAQMIRDGVAEGALHLPDDPDVEARTLVATIDGLLMHAVLDPSFCPAEVLADRVWQVVAERLGAHPPRGREQLPTTD